MKTLKVIIGFLVAAAFVWFLFQGVDIQLVLEAFGRLDGQYIALALACLVMGYGFRIVRWWVMLCRLEPSVPLGACVWPYLSSIAVNNVLPFRAGDALRVVGFRKQLRSPGFRILGTLVVERVLDLWLLAAILIGVVGFVPAGAIPSGFVTAIGLLALATLAGVVGTVLVLPWLRHAVRWITNRSFFARRNLSDRLWQPLDNLLGSLSVLRSPMGALKLVALSSLVWGFEGAVFASVAAGMQAEGGGLAPWFSLATGTLATLIPSTPGYVGTFDFFAARGLEAFGASAAGAIAFAVTVHVVLWLPLTMIGTGYLVVRGRRAWRASGTARETTLAERK